MASSILWAACRFLGRRGTLPLHRLGQFQNSTFQTVEIEVGVGEPIRVTPIDDFTKMSKSLILLPFCRLVHFLPLKSEPRANLEPAGTLSCRGSTASVKSGGICSDGPRPIMLRP
jgi:hypothetical protein